MPRKCFIPECPETVGLLKLPGGNPTEKFEVFKRIVNISEKLKRQNHLQVNQNWLICPKHFTEDSFYCNSAGKPWKFKPEWRLTTERENAPNDGDVSMEEALEINFNSAEIEDVEMLDDMAALEDGELSQSLPRQPQGEPQVQVPYKETKSCCMIGCNNDGRKRCFVSVPGNSLDEKKASLLTLGMHAMGANNIQPTWRICSRHFSPNSFKRHLKTFTLKENWQPNPDPKNIDNSEMFDDLIVDFAQFRNQLQYHVELSDWQMFQHRNFLWLGKSRICDRGFIENHITIRVESSMKVHVKLGKSQWAFTKGKNATLSSWGEFETLIDWLQGEDVEITFEERLKVIADELGKLIELRDARAGDMPIILLDQILNLTRKSPRYSKSSIVLALSVRNMSLPAYERLCDIFVLPNKRTLERYSGMMGLADVHHFNKLLDYATKKLPVGGNVVHFQVDEFAIKPSLGYYNGKLFGQAEMSKKKTGEIQLSSSMMAFHLSGLFIKYDEPVAYIPCATISTEVFVKTFLRLVHCLQRIGFIIVECDADNHASNSALFKTLTSFGRGDDRMFDETGARVHFDAKGNAMPDFRDGNQLNQWFTMEGVEIEVMVESDEKNPDGSMKFRVDKVISHNTDRICVRSDMPHAMKNVRNKFLATGFSYKSQDESWLNDNTLYSSPEEVDQWKLGIREASVFLLKKYWKEHMDDNLTPLHRLTMETLFPTPFQKQNFKLVNNLFHDSVIAFLKELASNGQHWAGGVAEIFEKIRRVLDILNVRSMVIGEQTRRPHMVPFDVSTWPNDLRRVELLEFVNFVKLWHEQGNGLKGLTERTKDAVISTVNGFVNVMDTLHERFEGEQVPKVLSGKLGTDPTEHNIGVVREFGFGSSYLGTVGQVESAKRKIRLSNQLRWGRHANADGFELSGEVYSDVPFDDDIEKFKIQETIEKLRPCIQSVNFNAHDDGRDIPQPTQLQVAGYAAKVTKSRLLKGSNIVVDGKKIACDTCVKLVVESIGDNSGNVTFDYLQWGGLHIPTQRGMRVLKLVNSLFLEITHTLENQKIFMSSPHHAIVLNSLSYEAFNVPGSNLSDECPDCQNVRGNVLKYFISTCVNIVLKAFSSRTTNLWNFKKMAEKQKRWARRREKRQEEFGLLVEERADEMQRNNQQLMESHNLLVDLPMESQELLDEVENDFSTYDDDDEMRRNALGFDTFIDEQAEYEEFLRSQENSQQEEAANKRRHEALQRYIDGEQQSKRSKDSPATMKEQTMQFGRR